MLFDPLTGRPVCLIDGNAFTTARTGAAGSLGLQQLARPDSCRLCLFGTGVQARVQLRLALDAMPMVRHAVYLTSKGRPAPAFEVLFYGLAAVSHAVDANRAVADSEIVITATTGSTILFDSGALSAGSHVNCVGADTQGKRELPDGLLRRSRFFVDDRTQSQQIGEGQWDPGYEAIEIGDLLAETVQLDRRPAGTTICDMTGVALQDLTVARMVFHRARDTAAERSVPWPW